MSRVHRFTLLAAILLMIGQMGAWVLDAVAPSFPHFVRFLLFFAVLKLAGDAAYFILWPHRREWAYLSLYFWDDFFTYARFAFPISVAQRLMETQMFPPWVYDAPPQTLLHHLIAGPYAAIAMYLINRWMREEAAETAYRQARNFLHLP